MLITVYPAVPISRRMLQYPAIITRKAPQEQGFKAAKLVRSAVLTSTRASLHILKWQGYRERYLTHQDKGHVRRGLHVSTSNMIKLRD